MTRLAALPLGVWALRIAWIAQPFTLGPVIGDALDGAGQPLRTVTSVAAWTIWAVALVGLLVPRTETLTLVRIWIPAAAAAAVWAALAAPDPDASTIVGIVAAVVAGALVLAPEIGARFVDGSSYGDERRLPLRPGAPLLLGPIQLAWAITVAGPTLGPLALLDRRWVIGSVATLVGVPAALLTARALHQLARRWVVFVPAGVVLHDLTVVREPVLFPRSTIVALGPAPADTTGHDLTDQALGLALRVRTDPPTVFAPAARRGQATAIEADEVLFTPTRPGAVMAVAASRRLRIG